MGYGGYIAAHVDFSLNFVTHVSMQLKLRSYRCMRGILFNLLLLIKQKKTKGTGLILIRLSN
jgi:hypothetical protein